MGRQCRTLREGTIAVITVALLLQSCAGLGVRSQAREHFDSGLALFNQGRYEEAIPHLDRATRLDPDFGRAYLYLGRSYLSLGRWKEALPPLRAAYRLSPDESRGEVLNILLDILFSAVLRDPASGSPGDAGALLRDMLNPNPVTGEPR